MRAPARGAVVVGGYVNALSVVRSLGRAGIPVAVVSTEAFDIAQYSRYAREHCEAGAAEREGEGLVSLLQNRAGTWAGRALYPTNDAAVATLSAYHDELSRLYHLVAPEPDVADCLLRKDRTEAIARGAGIDLPHSYGPASCDTLEAGDLVFPVVVKPVQSHVFARQFSSKLLVARDRDELLDCVARMGEAGIEGQIYDLVPGADDCFFNYCVYMDQSKEPVAGMAMHKLRKSPPFYGVCRVAETCESSAEVAPLREATVELLRRIGYRGMANAEFKRDPRDGRYRLMEINGRPFLMQGLAYRAGIDLPALAWREQVLGEAVTASSNGWAGVWIHLHADLLYATFFHRAEGLGFGDYAAPYRRPKAFAVWARDDPKPFWVQWAHSAKQVLGLLGSSQARSNLAGRIQPGPPQGPPT